MAAAVNLESGLARFYFPLKLDLSLHIAHYQWSVVGEQN
jgi:hypothetical protein